MYSFVTGDYVDVMQSNSTIDIGTWMRTSECLDLTQRFKHVMVTEPFGYVLPEGTYKLSIVNGKGIINIVT